MALRLDKERQKGFTLVEMLAVISIFTLLLTVVIVNFRGLGAARSVKAAKGNLVSDIRRMQSASLSSKDFNGTPSASYGVYITSIGTTSSYQLIGYRKDSSEMDVLETHVLPGVVIKEVKILRSNNTTTVSRTWEGLFLNPYGKSSQSFSGGTISANNDNDAVTTITISSTDNSASSTIIINGVTGGITE